MSKTKDKVISDLNDLRESEANQQKVMLRIDNRTCVLVHSKNATPEYAKKLKYKFDTGPDLIKRKPTKKQ